MSVGRICQREVDTAQADESVRCVAERMHQRSVGAIVVVSDVNSVVGIVTDRDLVIRVLAAGKDADTTPIRDVMTDSPRIAREQTPIESALTWMREGAYRRLPVLDKSGNLAGIVTLDDILRLLAEEFSAVGGLLDRESPQAAATPR